MEKEVNAKIERIYEVSKPMENGYMLCLQYCTYHYTAKNRESQKVYRFIWRNPGDRQIVARGQTRIPSVAVLLELVSMAMAEGWGHFDGEDKTRCGK